MECRKLLTDSNIEKIALAVAAACEADYDSSAIKRIKAAIQEADAAIENLWKALERGQAVDMITERIEKRKREKDDLQGQLAIEMGKQVTFTAPQIKAFLYSLKRGDVNDENNRRGMVNIFLRAIYLYDDRMTLILNGGDRPITIDDILLDEIEEHFEVAVSSHAGCSLLVAVAPPWRGRQVTPYPAPSKEGALPLYRILVTAWSLSIQSVLHCHKRVVRTKEGQEVNILLTAECIVLLAPLSVCG